MESSCRLIVISTFFHIISSDFARGNIAVIDMYLPVRTLIIDMVIIEKSHALHYGRVFEVFITIESVFISTDIACHEELENISEQIYLRAYRLHRIVKSGIGVIVKINFTVDIPAPYHVFRHSVWCRERQLCTHRHLVGIRPAWCLLLRPAPCRLGIGRLCKANQ